MLNNLTIFLVITTLFVYCGGKNVPKELIKYKLLIVGLTIGLIVCSFFKENIENFEVPDPMPGHQGTTRTPIYSCDDNETDETSSNYCSIIECKHKVHDYLSELLENAPPPEQQSGLEKILFKHWRSFSRNLNNKCKTTYRSGETHTFTGTSVNEAAHDTSRVKDEEWCRNPDNIIEDETCYNCRNVIHGNNVPKDPENPYRPNGECFRCANLGGMNAWRPTSCPRDPNYCSPMRRMAGLCN